MRFKNYIFAAKLLLTTTIAFTSLSVKGDEYIFSETIGDLSGQSYIVTGAFTGTAIGNNISNIDNVTVSYYNDNILNANTVDLGTLNAYGLSYITNTWTLGSAVISIDGAANDFLFSTGGVPTLMPYPTFLYSLSNNTPPSDNNMLWDWNNGRVFGYDQNSIPQNWSVTDVTTSAVPVPSTVWMFSSALAGLISFNRRKQAPT
ncbi:MAG: PEP-CTERM sorting domain-containing protein [Methylomonas sp.]|jgi:hypothetical protein